jgi:phenylalanyl-tRNA synthetase alpha chain
VGFTQEQRFAHPTKLSWVSGVEPKSAIYRYNVGRATLGQTATMGISLSELQKQLQALQTDATGAIEPCDNLEDLEKLRVEYLGKKGQLPQILRGMGQLSAEERPAIGAISNQVKDVIQNSLDGKKALLQDAQIQVQLAAETLDVTMPGAYIPLGRIHPLNGIIDRVADIFVGLGYTVATGPEMETDYYNFEALNTPADHPARDMQDTFYLPDGNLLRTHTSAVQIRYLEENEPPIRIISPGRCYRRDTVDATHSAVFHQIEILAVDQDLTFTDLKGTVKEFLAQLFGMELPIRFRASYFPFTEPSAEVDVQWQGKWLEIMGCGMVDPNVLTKVGCDPEVYSGFAAGFGAERLAMVLHEIDDIRRLYTSDLRFLRQF